MNRIKSYTEKELLYEAHNMLQSAHVLYGVQCQNCLFYKPEKEVDGYRGKCENDDHTTYWSQYCNDFEAKE